MVRRLRVLSELMRRGPGRAVIKPARLCPGDTIGVIAPASPTKPEHIRRALSLFATFGYKVQLGASVDMRSGYLSGTDQARVDDLHAMFGAQDVKAIICLRGGYGALRLLAQIDYEWIAAHPKIFVGYSDITALHTAIHEMTGLLTFHGPMIANLASRHPEMLSWQVLFELLKNPQASYTYRADSLRCATAEPSQTIREGTAQGALVGGNLSLVVSTLGTPYEIDTRDRIVFLEDVDEKPYRIDRMLTQLLLAGKLQEARGIVCTDFAKAGPTTDDAWTPIDVVRDRLQGLGVPCFYGLPIGHQSLNLTLPVGGQVKLDASAQTLALLEGCVTGDRT